MYLDLEFPLHLLMHAERSPLLLAGKDVLPIARRLAAPKHIFMHTGARTWGAAQTSGLPGPLARDLELHAAPQGLGHAEGLAQRLHPQVLLGGLPRLEAGLEGVAGHGRRGGEGRRRGGRVETLAEGVVDAWG